MSGVRYVIVHGSFYSPDQIGAILFELSTNSSLAELGHFSDGEGDAVVYRLRERKE